MSISTHQPDRAIVVEKTRERALRGADGVFGRYRDKSLFIEHPRDILQDHSPIVKLAALGDTKVVIE